MEKRDHGMLGQVRLQLRLKDGIRIQNDLEKLDRSDKLANRKDGK